MPDRAAEQPFTEAEVERPEPEAQASAEAENSTGRTGPGSPSSQPSGAPRIERLLPASTASGPVALQKIEPMEQESRYTQMVSCACGGRIRIEKRHPSASINQHATTKRHREWRRAMGFDGFGRLV